MSSGRVDTVPLLFRQQAAKYGERVALRRKHLGRWQEISWLQYGQRVREVALRLMALGLRSSSTDTRKIPNTPVPA